MVLVEGDDRVKRWLSGSSGRVDDWLYELIDAMAFYASERIKQRAPGHIDQLVDITLAHELDPGAFEAIAGVEPDITEDTFGRGLGSDPADYPVFVEVGTGIFGPVGEPISTIPGHVMGPIKDPSTGKDFFATVIQGQRPQRYVEQAHEDLVLWTPVKIRERLPELGRHE